MEVVYLKQVLEDQHQEARTTVNCGRAFKMGLIGEFMALVVSLEHFAEVHNNKKQKYFL